MYNKFKTKKSNRNPYLKVVLSAFAFVNCQSRVLTLKSLASFAREKFFMRCFPSSRHRTCHVFFPDSYSIFFTVAIILNPPKKGRKKPRFCPITLKKTGHNATIPTLTVNKVLIQRKPRSDRKKCEVFIIFTCCIRLCVV